jgi:hypothetical protein
MTNHLILFIQPKLRDFLPRDVLGSLCIFFVQDHAIGNI